MPTSAKAEVKKTAKNAVAQKSPAPAKVVPARQPAKAGAAKKPARKNGSGNHGAIAAEQRRNYIEVAAYFIAERHGFMPGRELADWAAAEAEIDRMLAEGRLT